MGTRPRGKDLVSTLLGKTRSRVLALLYSRPEAALYVRQIAREVGAGQGAIQRELQRLAEAGILQRSTRGREVYYQANRECPVFPELHGLILKTAGLTDVLRSALSALRLTIRFACIYGSQAAGTASAGSDVDLLVVGETEDLALHRAIRQAEERLGRTVNYTLLSPREFARRRRERGGFIGRVLAGPRIPILNDSDVA